MKMPQFFSNNVENRKTALADSNVMNEYLFKLPEMVKIENFIKVLTLTSVQAAEVTNKTLFFLARMLGFP